MQGGGRRVHPIREGRGRRRGEGGRGELATRAAPMAQLAGMYQACAAPAEPRYVDPTQPAALFPALAQESYTGILELISNGRVSYLKFTDGRYAGGYFCDRPESLAVPKYVELLFQPARDGTPAV